MGFIVWLPFAAWFCLLVVIGVKRPALFVALYLSAHTQFFGFIDFTQLEIPQTANVYVLTNLAALIATVLTARGGWKELRDYREFLVIVSALTLYGILGPVLRDESTLVLAAADGKDMLGFVLLPYLAVNGNRIGQGRLSTTILVVAVLLAGVVILAVEGFIAPAGMPMLDSGDGVHFVSPLLLTCAVVVELGNISERGTRPGPFIAFGLLWIVLVVQGHRSVFFATVLVVACAYLLGRDLKTRARLAAAFIFPCLLLLALGYGASLERSVRSAASEIMNAEGAIGARVSMNRFRFDAFSERQMLGHGFIHRMSAAGIVLSSNATSDFVSSYGTVDAGYVDLLVRFGVVGTVAFFGGWFLVVWRRVFRFRNQGSLPRLIGFMLLTYLVIALTWSVFTYHMGIVPFCLMVPLAGLPATGRRGAAGFSSWRLQPSRRVRWRPAVP